MEEEENQETEVEITSGAQEESKEGNEGETTETNPDEEVSELEKKKKKVCVCNKIKHGNPEEHEIDCEECQELPEAPIEPTPVVVETPPEIPEPVVNEEDTEDFNVVIVDPNQKIDTAEIGVATDDFPDPDVLMQENNALKSKLSSLSRENLQVDFKETQTDFLDDQEEDNISERETEAMRLMMERVKKRIELEQLGKVSSNVGGPVNLEFEILLDFMKDPKDPSKTMIQSSTVIKNPNDAEKNEVNQSMSLSVGNGESVEKEDDAPQKVEEIPMETEDLTKSHNDNDGDDEDEESTDDDTTTKVEVRDVATSMTEDFLDDLSMPDESLQDISLPYEKCVQTEAYTEVTYNDEDENLNYARREEEGDDECAEHGQPKHGHKHYWVPNRSVFKELDSLVRGISMVYSHFEEALRNEGFPGTKNMFIQTFIR